MKVYTLLVACFAVCSCKHFEMIFEENDINLNRSGTHWALIVAGSNSYYNYRHQADACHAYHVMEKHGIPKENIVVMMYDDIAFSEENPTPGILINHPHGSDVYGGVKIDYRREDVTPKNFLAVMRGDKEAMSEIGTGRVIASGPNDHVFVNFVDHGAPGILGFPDGMLHVTPFIKTILEMSKDQKFKQMVMYIEACESGSMFDGLLPNNINVFATTAANTKESSYACYYDKERKTYLGDVYSVKWMEDSDKENLNKETLQKQYKIVKQETNTSHVMEYGDLKMAKEKVAEFQGGTKYIQPEPVVLPDVPLDAVASEEVPLAILRKRYRSAASKEEAGIIYNQIQDLLKNHKEIDLTFDKIVNLASIGNDEVFATVTSSRFTLRSYDCYQQAVDTFHQMCYNLGKNDYAMRKLFLLVNLCEENVEVEQILDAINQVCQK